MDICKLILIGNVGRDPEKRFTQQGTPLLTFSVATNRKEGQEQVTQWFNCTLWDKLAERVGEHIQKGTRVYIEGRLKQRTYARQDGSQGTSMDVQVTELSLLSRPNEGSRAEPAADTWTETPRSLPSQHRLDALEEVPFW